MLLLGFLVLCPLTFGQASLEEDRALEKNATAIVDQYVDRLKAAGFKPPFVPSVVIKNTPQLISYSKPDRRVTVPTWRGLGEEEQRLFNEWAALAGDGATGRTLFEEFFNWFFIPHEMSHYLFEEISPSEGIDLFEVEKSANEFAVAFWLTRPDMTVRLDRIARAARRIEEGLPNPVPTGADPKRYFNENYDKLGQNPPAYGYYQFKFVADALAGRERLSFASMVQTAMQSAKAK